MKISFIIPNWNCRDYLAGCLASIMDADIRGLEREVVVVDNASTDGSAPMVEREFPRVELIRNSKNRGYARAVNQGVEASTGEFLFLLNNDVVLFRETVPPLIDVLKGSDDVGAVSPLLVYPDGRLQISCRRFPWPPAILLEKLGVDSFLRFRRLKWSEDEHLKGGTVDQPMFSAVLIRRECWNEVGFLDEGFPVFFNDVEWCYRLYRKTSYRMVLVPQSRAVHHEGTSVNKLGRRKEYHLYTGLLRFYLKSITARFSVLL